MYMYMYMYMYVHVQCVYKHTTYTYIDAFKMCLVCKHALIVSFPNKSVYPMLGYIIRDIQFHRLLKQQLQAKEWEKRLPPPPSAKGVRTNYMYKLLQRLTNYMYFCRGSCTFILLHMKHLMSAVHTRSLFLFLPLSLSFLRKLYVHVRVHLHVHVLVS